MDNNRQEKECKDQMTQDDNTQMIDDDDQTQMSQIFPKKHMRVESESDEDIGESGQQIDLDNELVNPGQDDTMSQTQESDSDSVESENNIFDNAVHDACEKRKSGHNVTLSDSDSSGPESGDDITQDQSSQAEDSSDHSQPPGNDMSQSEDSSDHSQPPGNDMSQSEDSSDSSQPPVDDMSRAQSSQSVNQSSNMSKASESKTPDVTESQRNRRHLKRTNKHREFMDALNGTKKSAEQIKNNKSKGKAPSPTKKRKTPVNASWVWKFAEKYDIAGVKM